MFDPLRLGLLTVIAYRYTRGRASDRGRGQHRGRENKLETRNGLRYDEGETEH